MSADKIDHKAEAEGSVAVVTHVYSLGALPAETIFALAQVHATLYAAEQQRIANLIAYTTGQYPNGSGISNGEMLDEIRRELSKGTDS